MAHPRRTIPFKIRISDTTSGPQLEFGGGLVVNEVVDASDGEGLLMVDVEKQEFLLVS